MAGLSHNPAALNCVKYDGVEGLTDPSAVCAYCEKNSPELMERLIDPTTRPAEDEPKQGRMSGLTEIAQVEDARPDIVKFFEKLGIVPGGTIMDIRTVDGWIFAGAYEIATLNGLEKPETSTLEAVITIRESGTQALQRVVWSKVCSFSS